MDDAINAITTHLSIGPYHGWSENRCRYVVIVNRIERRKRTSLEPGSPKQLWWHSGLGWESYPSCHFVSAPWHNQWLFAGHHSRRRSDLAMIWGRKNSCVSTHCNILLLPFLNLECTLPFPPKPEWHKLMDPMALVATKEYCFVVFQNPYFVAYFCML